MSDVTDDLALGELQTNAANGGLPAGLPMPRDRELLSDLPAPGEESPPIYWGHVGGLQEVVRRLTAVVAFLEGSER